MKLRWRRLFLLLKGHFGAITVRPTPQNVATSRLNSRSRLEHMDTIHVLSYRENRSRKVTRTMSSLLEQPRQRLTSQAIMASFLRQTLTQVLFSKPQPYPPATPSSSKTSSRITKLKCQGTQVTCLQMASTSVENTGQIASTQLESSSTEGISSCTKSSLDLVFSQI